MNIFENIKVAFTYHPPNEPVTEVTRIEFRYVPGGRIDDETEA